MVESLISMLAPVSASVADNSTVGVKPVPNAADESSLDSQRFTEMLAKAGNANAAPQRTEVKLAVVPSAKAQPFPVQPKMEADWLQTTGAEVVAEPLPDMDAVNGADVAAIVLTPQMQQQLQQLPEKDTELSLDVPLVDDAALAVVDASNTPYVEPVANGVMSGMPADPVATSPLEASEMLEGAVVAEAAVVTDDEASSESSVKTEPSLSLQQQATEAVVQKAKAVSKKSKENADAAPQADATATAVPTTNAAASAAAVAAALAAEKQSQTTQTTVQRSIMEAPVELGLQSQKVIRVKTAQDGAGVVENLPLPDVDVVAASESMLNSVPSMAADMLKTTQQNAAAQQSAGVMKQTTEVAAQPVTLLNAADVAKPLNGDKSVVSDRKSGALEKVSSQRSNAGLVGEAHNKAANTTAYFADILANDRRVTFDSNAQSDDMVAAVSSSTSDDVATAIGGATALSTSGSDLSVQSTASQDVRTSSFVQVRQDNPAHASVYGQIHVQVQQQLAQNGTHADTVRVQLNPAELGALKITMKVLSDGTARVKVEAERAETLDMLQKDAKGLASVLAEAGLQADAGSLEFSMSGEGQSGGEAQAQFDAARAVDESGEEFAVSDMIDGGVGTLIASDNAGVATVTQNYTLNIQEGLDIRV